MPENTFDLTEFIIGSNVYFIENGKITCGKLLAVTRKPDNSSDGYVLIGDMRIMRVPLEKLETKKGESGNEKI